MRQIIFFFIKNKNTLLFALLFAIALLLTINSHTYHKSKFVSSSNFISGSLYNIKASITNYFDLSSENKILLEENTRLREQLTQNKEKYSLLTQDSLPAEPTFEYVHALVINNNYSLTKNEITIKKQPNTTLSIDQGVISSKGIVGIINDVSSKYATVQSILNTKSQINAKLKKSSHFGTLIWDTKDPNVVQLIQIPRVASIAVGDTIVTGGKSTIFPKDILIGKIKEFTLQDDDNYLVSVALFNDMTNLNHVYIITNKDAQEIKALENHTDATE